MVGSIFAANAAKKAAKAQSQAFGQAADLQWRQYQQTREDLGPYREIGYDALNQLGRMFLPGGGAGGAGGYDVPQYIQKQTGTRQEPRMEWVESYDPGDGSAQGGSWQTVGVDEIPIYEQVLNPDYDPEKAAAAASGGGGPDYSEFYKSPGYQFRMDEGVRALDRSAAARGRLRSGGYGRELTRYGQGFASNEFNNYANRLASLAGIGQTSAAQTGQFGANAAQARGGFLGQMGTARASGYIGQANALLEGQRNFEQNNLQAAGIAAQFAGGFMSSRAFKENNTPIDYDDILKSVEALEVEGWTYRHDEAKRPHIGPYAEDFAEKFGVGNGEIIDPVDAIGVLFAAVKALAGRVRELEYKHKEGAD